MDNSVGCVHIEGKGRRVEKRVVEFRTKFGHLVLRSTTLLLRFAGLFSSSTMLTDYIIGYFGNHRNAKYVQNTLQIFSDTLHRLADAVFDTEDKELVRLSQRYLTNSLAEKIEKQRLET